MIDYINSNTKIDIICSEHGVFKQLPDNHISKKHGCPMCNKGLNLTKIISNKKCYIYLYRFYSDDEEFFKFGITKNINKRFKSKSQRSIYNIELIDSYHSNLYNSFLLEKYNLGRFKKYTPKYKFSGYTECFILPKNYDKKNISITTDIDEKWLNQILEKYN